MPNQPDEKINFARKCVFCGKDPKPNKNKEHVIPKWLMRLSGAKENRKWQLGFNYNSKDLRPIEIASTSFEFPACEKCSALCLFYVCIAIH